MVALDVCSRLGHRGWMNELLVGYARVSTEQQDLTSQRNGLHALGVGDDRIYVDHGLTGSNRDRPGLRLALAACRPGDTLVVTSWTGWPGRCPMLETSSTSSRGGTSSSASVAQSMIRPTRLGGGCSTVLAMVAEFETDL
ncbi:MAG: recombinase family protein, partial [Jiangellaceae bacterium]